MEFGGRSVIEEFDHAVLVPLVEDVGASITHWPEATHLGTSTSTRIMVLPCFSVRGPSPDDGYLVLQSDLVS